LGAVGRANQHIDDAQGGAPFAHVKQPRRDSAQILRHEDVEPASSFEVMTAGGDPTRGSPGRQSSDCVGHIPLNVDVVAMRERDQNLENWIRALIRDPGKVATDGPRSINDGVPIAYDLWWVFEVALLLQQGEPLRGVELFEQVPLEHEARGDDAQLLQRRSGV